jgi:hypothetical protein
VSNNRSVVRVALVAAALFCQVGAASAQSSLDDLLRPYLSQYELPALAAAVVRDGQDSRMRTFVCWIRR